MGYYGDYTGDYYGDPGIFDFIKSAGRAVIGTVGGAIGGFIKGGPVGAIAGAAGGAVRATRANIEAETLGAGGGGSAYTPALRAQHAAALSRGPVSSAAIMSSKHTALSMFGGGGMRGGGGGRRRRMNWANARALGRAERRIHSAVKHMSKYIRWVHPTKEGHAAPKFRRKKK